MDLGRGHLLGPSAVHLDAIGELPATHTALCQLYTHSFDAVALFHPLVRNVGDPRLAARHRGHENGCSEEGVRHAAHIHVDRLQALPGWWTLQGDAISLDRHCAPHFLQQPWKTSVTLQRILLRRQTLHRHIATCDCCQGKRIRCRRGVRLYEEAGRILVDAQRYLESDFRLILQLPNMDAEGAHQGDGHVDVGPGDHVALEHKGGGLLREGRRDEQ
mmetsp:Transcript_73324/g.157096  ORF Transcript_73324/g.157096 Transcript_73324/m.157096 type:complete len:217 (-) Transcript_73324:464-1114(-)